MNLTLSRFPSLEEATLGGISIDGRFCCFSLEDQHQDVKVPGETRIPAGRYPVRFRTVGTLHTKYASKFPEHRGMLEICDIPNFTAVMLHIGNKETETAGCPLVGDVAMAHGELGSSTTAYRRLYGQVANAILAGEPVFIDVKD